MLNKYLHYLTLIMIGLVIIPATIRADTCSIIGDINQDGVIGLEESIYALRVLGGFEEQVDHRTWNSIINLSPNWMMGSV